MPIVSQFRSAGYKFPYRHPPAKGFIEKALSAVGGALRGLGGALDEIGSIVQGPAAVKETGERTNCVDGLHFVDQCQCMINVNILCNACI